MGALFLWKGGAELAGELAPQATLAVPTASIRDRLGRVSIYVGGSAVRVGDVTGDGRADLVVVASEADKKNFPEHTRVRDAGAVYVWAAGLDYTGMVAPKAQLFDADPHAGDRLGNSTRFALDDVTGDGIADVIALAPFAEVAGFAADGKAVVWEGGSGLVGRPAPRAVLHGPPDGTTRGLGSTELELGDVTGDGVADLVLGSRVGSALFVWRGGDALAGEPAPLVRLDDAANDLGFPVVIGRSFLLGDVTADGLLDVVAGSIFADVGGKEDTGAVFVWAGGSALAGDIDPTAFLVDPDALPYDGLGWSPDVGVGLQLADVGGDGVLDVVASASRADVDGVLDSGAVAVWSGGSDLGTRPWPSKLSRALARAGDALGEVRGQGIRLADATGNGLLDVVAGGYLMDVRGVTDTGALLLWAGPILFPAKETAELSVPGAAAGDSLCR